MKKAFQNYLALRDAMALSSRLSRFSLCNIRAGITKQIPWSLRQRQSIDRQTSAIIDKEPHATFRLARVSGRLRHLTPYLCTALLGIFLFSSFLGARHYSIAEQNDDVFARLVPQIRSTSFVGSEAVWLVHERIGDLFHTNDGGKSWSRISGNIVGGKFCSVSFVSQKKGWAVGSGGNIWRSDDSGSTWTKIATLETSIPNQWSFISSQQLQFIDDSTGWIVETFGVWRTDDGGMHWKRVLAIGDPGVTGQPGDAAFLSSNLAVVSSDNGQVYRTDDGGRTWQIQGLISRGDFRGVSFVNHQIGRLIGYGPPDYNSTLYRSEDGGRTWQLSPIRDRGVSVHSIQFLSKDQGWATGALLPARKGNREAPQGMVMHTTDGGESWIRVVAPEGERFFNSVHFAGTSQGWLIARDNVYRTENGGKTWIIVLRLSR